MLAHLLANYSVRGRMRLYGATNFARRCLIFRTIRYGAASGQTAPFDHLKPKPFGSIPVIVNQKRRTPLPAATGHERRTRDGGMKTVFRHSSATTISGKLEVNLFTLKSLSLLKAGVSYKFGAGAIETKKGAGWLPIRFADETRTDRVSK